jgi:preprotein translocase subunit SecE
MNYSQIGDAKAVNMAITVELEATETYLKKSWKLEETYYKNKYPGKKAIKQFFRWVQFKILDIVWGNGESITKLLRSLLWFLIAMTFYDTVFHGNAENLLDYWSRFLIAPSVFLGIEHGDYSRGALSLIAAARFVGIALLTTLLVKRFGRR